MAATALHACIALLLCTAVLWWRSGRDPEGSRLLLQLSQRTDALLAWLQRHHPRDPRTLTLTHKWRGSLSSTGSPSPDNVAYTVRKAHIYICTRDPYTGKANRLEAAMHVLLHELAHLVTAEQQHPAAFWENAQFLADEAQAAGLYEPIAPGTRFCGRPLHGT